MLAVTTPPPPEAEIISKRLDELDMSARQAAITAGVSPTLMLQIRKGDRAASARAMAKIARALWWTPADLSAMGRPDAAAILEQSLPAADPDPAAQMIEQIRSSREFTEGQKRHLIGLVERDAR
jgi:predicted transcriptional regulator